MTADFFVFLVKVNQKTKNEMKPTISKMLRFLGLKIRTVNRILYFRYLLIYAKKIFPLSAK